MSKIKKNIILSIPIIIAVILISRLALLLKAKTDFKAEKIKREKIEYEQNKTLEESQKKQENIDNLNKDIEKLKKDLEAKRAVKLASVQKIAPVPVYPVGCELYRPIIAKYDWPVDQAMTTMAKESGCNPNSISPTNDHGLFQLHNEPIYNPDANVARAYQKYLHARVGYRNWSAWYAVCTTSLVPKYQGIVCSGSS